MKRLQAAKRPVNRRFGNAPKASYDSKVRGISTYAAKELVQKELPKERSNATLRAGVALAAASRRVDQPAKPEPERWARLRRALQAHAHVHNCRPAAPHLYNRLRLIEPERGGSW